MNYQDLKEGLSKMGIKTSERTLRKHYKEGLLPEPKRINKGRAGGIVLEFPPDALCDAAANVVVLEKLRTTYKELKLVRAISRHQLFSAGLIEEDPKIPDQLKDHSFLSAMKVDRLAQFIWCDVWEKVNEGESDLTDLGYGDISDDGIRFF